MSIRYEPNDDQLIAGVYLALVERVWPGSYDRPLVQDALRRTINVTAWDGERLIGCVRLLTDGYFFGTVPEILVDPAYQRQGIGRRLLEIAWEQSPTSLFLGAQPGNEGFFEKLGFQRSMASFVKKKPRPRSGAGNGA